MNKYQITVTTVPDNIVPFVKSLRLVANLRLKDANDLADFMRSNRSESYVLLAGVDQEVADHVAVLIHKAGGNAEVARSSIAAPMLLCPKAKEKYAWHWFRGPTRTE